MFVKSSASGCCLAFAYFFWQFQPGVAYKKKRLARSKCKLMSLKVHAI